MSADAGPPLTPQNPDAASNPQANPYANYGGEAGPANPQNPYAQSPYGSPPMSAPAPRSSAPQPPGYQHTVHIYTTGVSEGYAPGVGPSPAVPSAIPAQDRSSITTNLVLSIFFGWIPALIYFTQRQSVSPLSAQVYVSNLNFQLTRLIVAVLIFIPFVGIIAGLASIAFLVIAIVGAASAASQTAMGHPYQFPLAIPFFSS